jgi:hypothetical protein
MQVLDKVSKLDPQRTKHPSQAFETFHNNLLELFWKNPELMVTLNEVRIS